MTDLRIHPAIGVVRVGNSEQFFIGPEAPGVPGGWDPAAGRFQSFKDAAGKVLRQAARFRIFEFDASGNPVREITLDGNIKIEWRVHVANRKASFFTFNGQSGADADSPYTRRALRAPDAPEKPNRGRGQPERKNRRNAAVSDRRSLEIDPGEIRVSTPGLLVPLVDDSTSSPVKSLGEIQMEATGRLLFFGGKGQTGSTPGADPIEEYASNDGWFDDMSDGSIHASVSFPDGHTEQARSAWVIGGPPKFAPGIRNVVSLYDLLWDLAVRNNLPVVPGTDPFLTDLAEQQRAWQPQTNDFNSSYTPSFVEHIYPILSRAYAVRDVHDDPRQAYHGTIPDWSDMADPTAAGDQMRQGVFNRIRNPNSSTLDRRNMPRGLGDDYTTLDDFESNRTSTPPLPTAFLSLTPVQYALLKAWAAPSQGGVASFKSDWTAGDVPYAPIPLPSTVTPHGLDRSALENCVGGPFYPGIEVGWLIRHLSLYREAFRLRDSDQPFSLGPLQFQAGFFSQQMALPWQADFYDCHKEDHTAGTDQEPMLYMWWTAQRPDDLRVQAGGELTRWVAPFDTAMESGSPDPDDLSNLSRFEQMRTRWSELSFIVLEGDSHIAQK
jgi:hypothetical protein